METEYVAAVRTSSGKVENEIDIQVLTNDHERAWKLEIHRKPIDLWRFFVT